MEYYDSTITWIHALQQILLRSYSSLLSSHFHTFTLDWIIITVWVDGASNQERMARTLQNPFDFIVLSLRGHLLNLSSASVLFDYFAFVYPTAFGEDLSLLTIVISNQHTFEAFQFRAHHWFRTTLCYPPSGWPTRPPTRRLPTTKPPALPLTSERLERDSSFLIEDEQTDCVTAPPWGTCITHGSKTGLMRVSTVENVHNL